MNLYMYRTQREPTFTMGRMYLPTVGEKCTTLEPPVRELLDINNDGDFNDPGEGKVYGKTAILPGKYELKMLMSPSFKRKMPYLQNVKGFSSVMIHPLNDVWETKACIGVGDNGGRGRLVNSRGWSDIINTMLTEAEAKGEANYLYICQD